MKKTTQLLAAACTAAALFIGTNVSAQSVPQSQFRFGVGADALLPVGNLKNTANFGLGITPRLQYGIADNVALTLTSGYYHFFNKKIVIPGVGTMQNDLAIVPVKLGIKAFVLPHIYIGAEVGVGFEVANGGGATKLIASPSIGYASKHWDVGARYESFSGNGVNYNILGLRVAYAFGL